MVLVKTLESPLACKEIQPVHSEGDQPWDFFGMMLKLKLQYFGHLMQRVDLMEKTLMLGCRVNPHDPMKWSCFPALHLTGETAEAQEG